MNNSFTRSTKKAVHCPVYSMLLKEREKWCWSLTIVKTVNFFAQQRIFQFWKSYNLLLCTNSKWSHEQNRCCAHEVLKWIW